MVFRGLWDDEVVHRVNQTRQLDGRFVFSEFGLIRAGFQARLKRLVSGTLLTCYRCRMRPGN